MTELNRYQQYAKIYQIIDMTGQCDPYIGSTTQKTLAMRLSQHVNGYKMWKQGKRDKTMSFDIIGNGDYKIELIESYPCNNRDELNAREGYYQKARECCNARISGRTKKQYRKDNADKIKQRHKKYYKDNADNIRQQKKKYRQDNADKIRQREKKYRQDNADKIRQRYKQYYNDNADKIRKQKKKYRQDNKDKLNKKSKCLCGGKFTHKNRTRHMKTKKHKKYEANSTME